MHFRQTGEATRFSQLLHRERRARIVFPLGRDAIMAGHVIQVVGLDQ